MSTPRGHVLPALLLLAAWPLAPAVGQTQTPLTPEAVHHLHHDSAAYIASLDDPTRDSWQKPREVVEALNIKEGESIADIGAGSGYFALRFAHHVGATGHVYAVDVEPAMILHLNHRIRETGAWNVRTVLADPDDPLLAPASLDRVFICDTWHHIENQDLYLERLKALLKPGGQIVMIDFQKRDLPVGPPVSMKIAREDLIRQMNAAGFRLEAEHSFLPYQYFLVFGLKTGLPQ
jgi:ubiquinone/menaquinone biosynthesis C-methylase UbiE